MPVTDDDEYDGPVSMAATQSTTSKAEQRKSNKPIMEKRRRARINHCLNELKSLILNAMKKDPARHSKLEKADILEMTVKHLQNVQSQQLSAAVSADPGVVTRFRSGFDECAAEVSRFITRLDGVDHGVKQRLSAHLHRCMSSLQQITPPGSQNGTHDDNNNSNQRTVIIPSRLPTGELALVLPNYNSFLAAAPNSAFTAIKPPTESSQRRFQPFQVEIPNSQLKAHISIPEEYDKQKNINIQDLSRLNTSPKPPMASPDSFEQINSLQAIQIQRTLEEKRPDAQNRIPLLAIHQKPSGYIDRLHSTQIHQKPNPNYILNPKLHVSPPKFPKYPEQNRSKSQDEQLKGKGVYQETVRMRVTDCIEPNRCDQMRMEYIEENRKRVTPPMDLIKAREMEENRMVYSPDSVIVQPASLCERYEPPLKTARYGNILAREPSSTSVIVGEPLTERSHDHSNIPHNSSQDANMGGQRDMWRPW